MSLSNVMKSFKGRWAHRVNNYLSREGPLWQKAFYDHGCAKTNFRRPASRLPRAWAG
ncbi:MAG: hypothetical protein ACRESZ_08240 [Methylococcales bacterium]